MEWVVNHVVKMSSVDYVDGDVNIKALAVDCNNKGATRYPKDDCVVYEIYERFAKINEAKGIVLGNHGDIDNYRLYIEISSADDLTPVGLFNSTNEDGDQIKWAEWCKPNCPPVDIDGRLFVNSSANTGLLPSMSKLLPVFNSLFDLNTLPKPEEIPDE